MQKKTCFRDAAQLQDMNQKLLKRNEKKKKKKRTNNTPLTSFYEQNTLPLSLLGDTLPPTQQVGYLTPITRRLWSQTSRVAWTPDWIRIHRSARHKSAGLQSGYAEKPAAARRVLEFLPVAAHHTGWFSRTSWFPSIPRYPTISHDGILCNSEKQKMPTPDQPNCLRTAVRLFDIQLHLLRLVEHCCWTLCHDYGFVLVLNVLMMSFYQSSIPNYRCSCSLF